MSPPGPNSRASSLIVHVTVGFPTTVIETVAGVLAATPLLSVN